MMLDRYLWCPLVYERCVPGNDGNEVFCDLNKSVPGISPISTDIVISSQRPDLVIVDREKSGPCLSYQ